jgi:hypothetical protein
MMISELPRETRGYRVLIGNRDLEPAVDVPHSSGGAMAGASAAVDCPNCGQPLFPVFKISNSDPAVRALGIWTLPVLQVLVCPACALYMEPYWILFSEDAVSIEGGERDGGKILQEIEAPYSSRMITLRQLGEEESPESDEVREALLSRKVAPGVYHQLCGLPFRRDEGPLSCCVCSKPMLFGGIVDSDDLNVPLYEPVKRPVALIIGDSDCLHFFTCAQCSVVGVRWQHS